MSISLITSLQVARPFLVAPDVNQGHPARQIGHQHLNRDNRAVDERLAAGPAAFVLDAVADRDNARWWEDFRRDSPVRPFRISYSKSHLS